MKKIGLYGFEDIDNMTERAKLKKELIKKTLREHHKIDKPVKSEKIEKATGLQGSEVRAVIRELRLDWLPVAENHEGYFWAEKAEDLWKTYDRLNKMSQSNGEVARAISLTRERLRRGKKFEGEETRFKVLSKKELDCCEKIVLDLYAKRTIDEPMVSAYYEKRMKLSGPEVRNIIHALRMDGYPIGSNQSGYFWAHKEQELAQTWKQLYQRSGMISTVAQSVMKTCFILEKKEGK